MKTPLTVFGALALGAVWYLVAGGTFPASIAQIVAVTGALLIAAVLPVLALRAPTHLSDQAIALDVMAQEVWVVDRTNGCITYANTTASDRIKPRHASEIIPPDQRGILDGILRDCCVPQDCVLQVGAVSFRPSVTCVTGTPLVMLVLYDVTQEIADERLKDAFISNVSHELRTPLTSIKGSMGLLLSNAAGELPKPARDLLEISHRNADRLVVILNDILDLQKISDDGMVFECAPVDASALVHEAIAASSISMQRLDLTVDVQGAQGPVMINSDANRIMQVLGNLLSNAAKFSRPHSRVSITVEEDAQSVTFHVRDEGDGIAEQDQAKIFQRFADMANSDRQQKGGSGLGLSICKAIVDRLGGSIRFESTAGVGTTFSFWLPKVGAREVDMPSQLDLRCTG